MLSILRPPTAHNMSDDLLAAEKLDLGGHKKALGAAGCTETCTKSPCHANFKRQVFSFDDRAIFRLFQAWEPIHTYKRPLTGHCLGSLGRH